MSLTKRDEDKRVLRQKGKTCGLFMVATALAFTAPASAWADEDTDFAAELGQAITQGTPSLQVRPRYEIVQQHNNGTKAQARAGTARILLGYSIKPFHDFGATLQLIDVAVMDSDLYNVPVVNNHTDHVNIADPKGANVNQAFLSYEGLPQTRIATGRQIITLDDQRFVGNVDFRQQMQTFDAVTVVNKSLPDIKLFGAYIFGIKDIENEQISQNTYLAEINWTKYKMFQADGYGYWYGDEANQNYSALPGAAGCYITTTPQSCNSATYGGRIHGVFALPEEVGLSYAGEFARQHSYDGGSTAIMANYAHGGAKLTWNILSLGGDYMMMGSNEGTYGFQTPLATKHAFNGWSEMFLTTPKEGLRSIYATGTASVYGVKLLARYYTFSSDYQHKDLGHEWDFSVTYPFTSHISGGIEYAKYHAGNAGFTDTTSGVGNLVNTNAMWAFINAGF